MKKGGTLLLYGNTSSLSTEYSDVTTLDSVNKLDNMVGKEFDAFLFQDSLSKLNADLLSNALKALKCGGSIIVRDTINNNEKDKIVEDAKQQFMFGGVNGFDVNWKDDTTIEISGTKPNWQVGTSFSLNNKSKKQNNDSNDNNNNSNVWKLDEDDTIDETITWKIGDDDDDLVDEDDLLQAEDLAMPVTVGVDDCEQGKTVGKNKACKNCTCGRADMQDGEDQPQTKSACGNCALGDAFRCATCPHLGKPSWKEGERVTLDL